MGYGRLKMSSSGCVHFMFADFFEGDVRTAIDELRRAGIKCAYVDCRKIANGDLNIANAIACELNLQNAPYAPHLSAFQPEVWVPFLDDLGSLSEVEKGIVLFVDSAPKLLSGNGKGVFRLIEAFLIQVHHWLDKRKPCHLCFQMESDNSLKGYFGSS